MSGGIRLIHDHEHFIRDLQPFAFIPEKKFGHRLCQARFSDPAWSKHQERCEGSIRRLKPSSRQSDSLRDSLDGSVLTDNTLLQSVFDLSSTNKVVKQ